jgi:hypothetical protein
MRTINFVQEFTDTPGGRYRKHGDFSGEQFRDDLLKPALQENEVVILNLNGAFGFPPSFIDEAFGILIDQLGIDTVKKRLRIELSDDPVAQRKLADVYREHGKK